MICEYCGGTGLLISVPCQHCEPKPELLSRNDVLEMLRHMADNMNPKARPEHQKIGRMAIGSVMDRVKSMKGNVLTKAAQDVLAERQRQIEREGWTPEHDDEHGDGELACAAAAYALQAAGRFVNGGTPNCWPWNASDWKPATPRRDLVKATALLLAEIERRDRAKGKT